MGRQEGKVKVQEPTRRTQGRHGEGIGRAQGGPLWGLLMHPLGWQAHQLFPPRWQPCTMADAEAQVLPASSSCAWHRCMRLCDRLWV